MGYGAISILLTSCSSLQSTPSSPADRLPLGLVFSLENSPFDAAQITRTLQNIEGELEALFPIDILLSEQELAGAQEICSIEFKSLVDMLSRNLSAPYSIKGHIFYQSGSMCQIELNKDALANQGREYFRDILRHEIGHLIVGMAHNSDPASIMYASPQPGMSYQFTTSDIRRSEKK